MAEAAGATLKRGDVIAVVDTEKGAIEIEVFQDGVLERVLIEPGQRVPVGTALAIITGTGDAEGRSGEGDRQRTSRRDYA